MWGALIRSTMGGKGWGGRDGRKGWGGGMRKG